MQAIERITEDESLPSVSTSNTNITQLPYIQTSNMYRLLDKTQDYLYVQLSQANGNRGLEYERDTMQTKHAMSCVCLS
jgi:hypothetical protein